MPFLIFGKDLNQHLKSPHLAFNGVEQYSGISRTNTCAVIMGKTKPTNQTTIKKTMTNCFPSCLWSTASGQLESFPRVTHMQMSRQPFGRLYKGDKGDEAWHWSWKGFANDCAWWHQSVPPGKAEEPDQSLAVAFLEFFLNVSFFKKMILIVNWDY